MHDVNRRIFLGGLAALPALAALVAARNARARTGPPPVGYLSGGVKDGGLDVLYRGPIIKGLAEQGFVAPDRLRWLDRYAGNIPERATMVTALEGLTRELVAEGADVIIANGGSTAPAMTAAGPVPVVYGFSGDPVAAGIANGLAHPRGNATGVTL